MSHPTFREPGAQLARTLANALRVHAVTIEEGVKVAPTTMTVWLSLRDFEAIRDPEFLEDQFERFLSWLAVSSGYVGVESVDVRLMPDDSVGIGAPVISATADERLIKRLRTSRGPLDRERGAVDP